MSTKAVFTMKLEPELRDTFMAEAAADDRPAAQVVRELMRDYITRRREAREYDDFVRRKVEVARKQRDAGLHFSNEEVEADAAARRVDLLRRAGEAGL
ncbi:antitoxin of toxin-antitoxin stability system [Xanthomonas citri pv. citri]|nr:antitoxin of toxin-antitoxin stability system [Xanthomonas citri pv. citri]MBD1563963.1 antitoxin of toxin-antitoxin stability system [Xanthomonas citri pv. citri]